MSHRPYPDVDRALSQLARHDFETAPQLGVVTTEIVVHVKWPQPPQGWSTVAGRNAHSAIRSFMEALSAVQPPTAPSVPFQLPA